MMNFNRPTNGVLYVLGQPRDRAPIPDSERHQIFHREDFRVLTDCFPAEVGELKKSEGSFHRARLLLQNFCPYVPGHREHKIGSEH